MSKRASGPYSPGLPRVMASALFLSVFSAPAFAGPCLRELQEIVAADQADYRREMIEHPERPLDVQKAIAMNANDLKRRKRVGELVGEGCLVDGADFAAAALIFQHGEIPSQFYLAFVWSLEAVRLGLKSERGSVALGIDRYLTKSGRKQLFGSQVRSVEPSRSGRQTCFCLEPTEESFPESRRAEYLNEMSRGWKLLEHFNRGKNCAANTCSPDLKATPKGSVPGFW